jgi:uncharacterized protein (TIRG00374 family)
MTMDSTVSPSSESMPAELDVKQWRTRLLELCIPLAVLAGLVFLGPGRSLVRPELTHVSAGWLIAGVGFEVLSCLSYVLVFRTVFCPRMSWKLSYEIGMSEQAANSLLPAGGAGGLALGVWALRRAGVDTNHIARRSVAFFLLTSLANVLVLIVFAALFAVGVLHGGRTPVVTYAFAAAGLAAIVALLALAKFLPPKSVATAGPDAGRFKTTVREARAAMREGVRDSLQLLRDRSPGLIAGSMGYLLFDIAVLAVAFEAFGDAPPFGVLVVAYIIGQLGGLLPLPGGVGGIEGGLIGAFAVYHVPLAMATLAVLAYRVVQIFIPALLGSLAFNGLRNTLRNATEPAILCMPLVEPVEVATAPMEA